ncbi:hypothetical protein [Bacillus sp. XF8]|uniref:hypothetical protein n=1 Tax=Bacillus sp. XF8 TaxID=2819289 RepID=UPI0027DE1379|nr:hypothetical protein [Bacillus sp. XF8]
MIRYNGKQIPINGIIGTKGILYLGCTFVNHFGNNPSRLIANQTRDPASVNENKTESMTVIAAALANPEIIKDTMVLVQKL